MLAQAAREVMEPALELLKICIDVEFRDTMVDFAVLG